MFSSEILICKLERRQFQGQKAIVKEDPAEDTRPMKKRGSKRKRSVLNQNSTNTLKLGPSKERKLNSQSFPLSKTRYF